MEASLDDYSEPYDRVGNVFLLVAPGQEPVVARAARGFWIDSSAGRRDFYIYLPPAQFPRIVAGVEYRLAPQDERLPATWRANEGVRVVRPGK